MKKAPNILENIKSYNMVNIMIKIIYVFLFLDNRYNNGIDIIKRFEYRYGIFDILNILDIINVVIKYKIIILLAPYNTYIF